MSSARLAAGRSLLEPALRTSRALDQLSAARRASFAPGSRHGSTADRPQSPCVEEARRGGNRPLEPRPAFARSLQCSRIRRRSPAPVARRLHRALEQSDRQTLHRLGVRLGPLDVFHPALLKPSAQQWRAILQSVRANHPVPALPAAGAATLDADAEATGAALAYRRLAGSGFASTSPTGSRDTRQGPLGRWRRAGRHGAGHLRRPRRSRLSPD